MTYQELKSILTRLNRANADPTFHDGVAFLEAYEEGHRWLNMGEGEQNRDHPLFREMQTAVAGYALLIK